MQLPSDLRKRFFVKYRFPQEPLLKHDSKLKFMHILHFLKNFGSNEQKKNTRYLDSSQNSKSSKLGLLWGFQHVENNLCFVKFFITGTSFCRLQTLFENNIYSHSVKFWHNWWQCKAFVLMRFICVPSGFGNSFLRQNNAENEKKK